MCSATVSPFIGTSDLRIHLARLQDSGGSDRLGVAGGQRREIEALEGFPQRQGAAEAPPGESRVQRAGSADRRVAPSHGRCFCRPADDARVDSS
jgi:hypothetical protein